MKKVVKITLLCMVLSVPVIAFAQDSNAPVDNFFGFIWDFIPVKYKPIVFTGITGLYLFEQFLAATSKIKANSTFQLIIGWVNKVYSAVKKKTSN